MEEGSAYIEGKDAFQAAIRGEHRDVVAAHLRHDAQDAVQIILGIHKCQGSSWRHHIKH